MKKRKTLLNELKRFDPGRFEVTIAGNDDGFYIKLVESYSYTNEGSGEEEGWSTIFECEDESLTKLENKVVKILERLEP